MTFGLQLYIIILGCKSEVKILPEQKKRGRPTDNPKETSIHVRLTEECVILLQQYCAQENVGRAEAVRRGILGLRDQLLKK